ncbi:MAG: TIGR02921 family PEP-CTERM protein, partial [Chamaesiphon sp.]|nr:TIGR02921 family PEP-CTERM protein [Chamaesiphon sp.]
GMALARDSIGGTVPIDLMIPFMGLIGVPLATTIAGSKRQQIKSPLPLSLFELFYAIEAPILAACVIRLFMLRELTTASSFLLVSGVLGFAGSCYWFWQQRQAESVGQRGNLLSLLGLSLFLLVSLYLVAISSFFLLPVGIWLLSHLEALLVSIIVLPLFACAFAVSSAPFGMLFVAQKLWWQNLQQSIERYGKWQVQYLVGGLAIIWLGVLISIQYQPQIEAFALLKQQPVDRSANLQKSEQIRQGLLNAYLADYRYLRTSGDRDILSAYEWLKFPQPLAQGLQDAYDFLTEPFVYQGTRSDRQDAEKLYAEFFDLPILRGEKETIRHAVESNFNRAEANAGLLSIDAKRVLLTNQQVKVTPQGDWADIELHEIYQNQTLNREEIFYYFSLPESATVTGIWLGETDNKALSFPFQVSTRGAAQKIYKEQIQQRVDPALLEQVGPQNYRLRVYPVLPQGQPMNMWMTYKVMKQDNSWPLPQLNERRNVYWNRNTNRTIDGKAVALGHQWLPNSIAANKSAPAIHQMTLPNGSNIIAKPFDPNGYSLPQNKRLAIVLDGSYSMNGHRPELVKTIKWLRSNILPRNQIDLYLTASESVQPQLVPMADFKPDRAIFYGSIKPHQMLAQFESLSKTAANPNYDAIIAITARGSYELSADQDKPKSVPAPLWMVHLGGLPFAYDDATLSMIQHSGGSVSTEIKNVMQRIATQPSLGKDTSLLSVVDNYAWFLSQAIDPTAKPKDDSFDAIAARQWITQVSQSLQPEQLKELDAVHVLAKRYNLVTPYSSMIVLVNDQQNQDLKNAEQGKDRFKRQVEDKQQLSPSSVSATPEPAEWLLLAIVAVMLGGVYRHNISKSVV